MGCPFYPWRGLVAGLKRAPHMGCMMRNTTSTSRRKCAPCQASPLPATPCPPSLYTHKYPHESLPLASPPGSPPLCPLIANTQAAAPPFLGGAVSPPKQPSTNTKRAPPPTYLFYFLFLLLCKWLQISTSLHKDIKVRFARCSPITSSCTLKGLQYQLHHFRLLFLHSPYIHTCLLPKACRPSTPQ